MTTLNALFAVLTIVAAVAALALVVASAVALTNPRFRERWLALRLRFSGAALASAWIVGVVCTCGSLYLQFGEHLIPCDLCWFQRICMYPQALLLGVANGSGDRYLVKRYAVPLAAIGAVISVIHIQLSNIMSWLGIVSFPGCSLTAPCTAQPISEWGVVTIPMMALAGFLLIITLLLSVREDGADDEGADHDGAAAAATV